MMKRYEGPLDEKKMERNAKKAYETWKNQKSRCNNKNNKRYKHYGAKGIKVLYGSREFVYWYINEIEKFKGNDPTVGRIDHDKNYSFDNIEIQSRSDNSKESLTRNSLPNPRKRVLVRDGITDEKLVIAKSVTEAAKLLSVSVSLISAYLTGRISQKQKYWKVEYC